MRLQKDMKIAGLWGLFQAALSTLTPHAWTDRSAFYPVGCLWGIEGRTSEVVTDGEPPPFDFSERKRQKAHHFMSQPGSGPSWEKSLSFNSGYLLLDVPDSGRATRLLLSPQACPCEPHLHTAAAQFGKTKRKHWFYNPMFLLRLFKELFQVRDNIGRKVQGVPTSPTSPTPMHSLPHHQPPDQTRAGRLLDSRNPC